MDKDRKYLWSWDSVGTGEDSSVTSLTMIAMPEFNERGIYTKEEVKLLIKILNSLPCPKWLKWDIIFEKNGDIHYTADDNRKLAEQFNSLIMKKFNELNK